jgi:hypothetical protein
LTGFAGGDKRKMILIIIRDAKAPELSERRIRATAKHPHGFYATER